MSLNNFVSLEERLSQVNIGVLDALPEAGSDLDSTSYTADTCGFDASKFKAPQSKKTSYYDRFNRYVAKMVLHFNLIAPICSVA